MAPWKIVFLVTGILTTDRVQAIFVDTPGLLEPKYALQHAMPTIATSEASWSSN